MSIDVALTPAAAAAADVCIVVDSIRATTVVAHAFAAGYRTVLCVAEIEQALLVAATVDDSVLGGERDGVRIDGFALGNSPSEYDRAQGTTVILTTTNGTRAVVACAGRSETLLCGALVNLEAVARFAAAIGGRIVVCCAGAQDRVALDDVYVAGRYVNRLTEICGAGVRSDAALVAAATAFHYASPEAALGASSSARRLQAIGLDRDVASCARESILNVVPRVVAVTDEFVELDSASTEVNTEQTIYRSSLRSQGGVARC